MAVFYFNHGSAYLVNVQLAIWIKLASCTGIYYINKAQY
ncbi:MAG: hypothetical protein OFPII_20820 [Osedax symbiont Rs1]|nr:MAG: hypothetical protein OFPII_20820 [Osedax symbiont Rs1]